jgi:hypothetical protein
MVKSIESIQMQIQTFLRENDANLRQNKISVHLAQSSPSPHPRGAPPTSAAPPAAVPPLTSHNRLSPSEPLNTPHGLHLSGRRRCGPCRRAPPRPSPLLTAPPIKASPAPPTRRLPRGHSPPLLPGRPRATLTSGGAIRGRVLGHRQVLRLAPLSRSAAGQGGHPGAARALLPGGQGPAAALRRRRRGPPGL